MEKLKPCPFCGGKVHMWKMEQTLSPKIGKIIECDSCGVRFHFHWASVYEQAAFHWNRRALPKTECRWVKGKMKVTESSEGDG